MSSLRLAAGFVTMASGLWFGATALLPSPIRLSEKNTATGAKAIHAESSSRPVAAPGVTLIEGERVKPEEVMAFSRFVLIEEGDAVAAMSGSQANINTVRHNFNHYRIGYSLPAQKDGERYVFRGEVKGWRAASTGDVSIWPPILYPASRKETMRQAKLLEPIPVTEWCDEMNQLRVYYLATLVGHDGEKYQAEPAALAFFIHPETGHRMTVILRGGRTYGAVDAPLATTSQIYVQQVASYSAGPLGLGKARVPSVFFSKSLRSEVEPFEPGNNFDRLMTKVLAAHESGPLATEDFNALFAEMGRYTRGKAVAALPVREFHPVERE